MIYVLGLILLCVLLSPIHVSCQSVNPYAQPYDAPRTFLRRATSNEASNCPAPGQSVSVNPAYPGGVSVTSSTACLQASEVLCRTPSGAVGCNTLEGRCRTTKHSNVALYPGLVASGSESIQQCVVDGKYRHPDANVVLIAQCVVSFIVILICTVLVLFRTWHHLNWFLRIWFIIVMIICMILLPSFYYLNGLIGAGAAIFAVVMFSTQEARPAALGITGCISTIMWFTFDSGLGFLIHTTRLRNSNAGDPAFNLYENHCDAYYRYSYSVPFPLVQDIVNPSEPTEGPCLRGWLSTELFFGVLLILSLVVLGVAGAHALKNQFVLSSEPVRVNQVPMESDAF